MISSRFTKLSLCALLIANSFGHVAVAQADAIAAIVPLEGEEAVKTKKQCAEPYLRQNKKALAVLAVLCTLALVAKPTKGSHELSEELFLNDTTTWLRNAFGWFGKDAKITSVDEETGLPIYKPGYEAQGFVGAVHKLSKELAPITGIMLLVKAIEPWLQTGNLFDDGINPKAV